MRYDHRDSEARHRFVRTQEQRDAIAAWANSLPAPYGGNVYAVDFEPGSARVTVEYYLTDDTGKRYVVVEDGEKVAAHAAATIDAPAPFPLGG